MPYARPPVAAAPPVPRPSRSAPPRPPDGPPNPAAQWRADAALLLVSAIWGGTFVMVKDALGTVGPFTFVAVRFTLAGAVMVPFLVRARQPGRQVPPGPSAVGAGLALGVALFAGYAFQTAGLQLTTPARAGFVTGTSVAIVPLLSAVALRKHIPARVWLGVALAAVGLGLLSLGPDLLAGGPLLSAETFAGDLLVLGCAVAFAVQIVALGELAPRFPALPLTAWQFLAAAALGGILALAVERPALSQLGPILPAALFTGLFATAGAFLVQARAQRFTSATHTALIFSTEPVFGAAAAYLLVGEVLSGLALVGCGLIVAGMLLAQLAELRGARGARGA